MRSVVVSRLAALATGGAVLFCALSGAATAAPLASASQASKHQNRVLLVHDKWDDRRDRRHGHHRLHVVDAPFTHVESGYGRRRVAVDAPFASVRVSRFGTWVRAPFVDLFVPR